jgi:hypothetical protein
MTTGFLPQLDNRRLVRMVEISRILNSETHLDQLLSTIIKEAAEMTHLFIRPSHPPTSFYCVLESHSV